MMKTLLILAPPLAAIGMMLWLRHARQVGGRRWIGHWLGCLAPMGLLAGLHGLGLVTNTVATVLIVPAVLGAAAFAGGALYLVVSALAASESVRAAGATALEGFREAVNSPGSDDDSGYWNDDSPSSGLNDYAPIDYWTEENDDYYRNGWNG